MRRVLLLCGVVLLCGAAYGAPYSFDADAKFDELSAKYANFDNALNWTPTRVSVPGTTADSYSVALDCSTTQKVRLPITVAANAYTLYFGSINWTGGKLIYTGYGNNQYRPDLNIWRFVGDNGQDGSFTVAGANTGMAGTAWNQHVTLDLDGSLNLNPAVWSGEGAGGEGFLVRMRGLPTGTNDRTYSFKSSIVGQCRGLVVDNGVTNLTFVAPASGYNGMPTLTLNASNSASGDVYVGHAANMQSLTVNSACDVSNLNVYICHQTNVSDGAARVPGRRYGDFTFSNDPGGYWGGTERFETLRIVDGDMHVKSLSVNPVLPGGGTNASGTVTFQFDTDNNGVTRDLTVDTDAKFGRSAYTSRIRAIFKTNSSTVDIGRDLIFYKNGSGANLRSSYLVGGSATIHVGRHFTVEDGTTAIAEGWDPGTSTFIFDGNGGAYSAQTIKSAGAAGLQSVPFYNVQINNPGGIITLADNLLLKGDFGIVAGTFNPATYYVVLAGGVDCETTAQEIDVNGADLLKLHIKAGSNTYVKLMSDLAVSDNLDIDAGCKLFIGEYTLDLTGSDAAAFLGQNVLSGAGTWTLAEGGEIIGSGVIPEPSTLLLLGTGLIGAMGYVRRRRMS